MQQTAIKRPGGWLVALASSGTNPSLTARETSVPTSCPEGNVTTPQLCRLRKYETRAEVDDLLENHHVELEHAISHAPLRLGVGSRRFPQNGREEEEEG
jgi:hypothetical protein